MKNSKPNNIVLNAAFLMFAFVFVLLFLASFFFDDITFVLMMISAASVAIFTYILFYFLVKKLIHDRLQVLYRVIKKGKSDDLKKTGFSMSENVIEQATLDTSRWADERQAEISKLKEQEAFRREFLGNLAHELKTPVFSIQGYILTLLEGGLEDENVNVKFLERASKATERMASMLDDLDQITKLEVNELNINLATFDVADLAKEVMESLEIPAKEKNIKLIFDKRYDPIKVVADRTRISQVFTNLISNAINYGNENGKTKISFIPMEDLVMVEVTDDGPGIKEEDLGRLFERFFRVEQSRNRNEGGSGLGLAIVKHIIETQHNQTINVKSSVGEGSTFTFTLKLA